MAYERQYSWERSGRATPPGSWSSNIGLTHWHHGEFGEFGSSQCAWHPYWVHCKFHGWQQCPACSAEIAISQVSPCGLSGTSPPRKRPRCSQDDDLPIDQIVAFVSTLNMEQISTAASVLLEHYTRSSVNIATPHAEDIAGIHVILSLMNFAVVQYHEQCMTRRLTLCPDDMFHSYNFERLVYCWLRFFMW